jgi:hypothetical protein
MDWHAFAENFPRLEGAEWGEFKAGIKKTGGCKENPVKFRILPDGKKQGLDGRERYRACKELRIKCEMKKVSVPDADVIDFIVRHNINRRHMTATLRERLVIELRSEGKSYRAIANALQVDPRTVRRDLDASGGAFAPPHKISGRDGKHYSPTREAPGDAYEGPLLCDRCARVGAVNGCTKCAAMAAKPANQAPRRSPPKKSGKPAVDWKLIEAALGIVMRAPNEVVSVYPDEKKHWEYTEACKLLDEIADLYAEWRKRLGK